MQMGLDMSWVDRLEAQKIVSLNPQVYRSVPRRCNVCSEPDGYGMDLTSRRQEIIKVQNGIDKAQISHQMKKNSTT